MSTLGKLAFLLFWVAFVAVGACWTTSHFMGKPGVHSLEDHQWLHSQLGITADQDKALEKEEIRFAAQRRKLVDAIHQNNAELATVLARDREYSAQVRAAVEKIHQSQQELENATLEHIFAMKPILSPAQFDKLLQLTGQALNSPSDF